METLSPGMHVAGKYVLDRPLARGAMGEVWIGVHASLGGEMAIKFLSRGPAHDGEDEATAMARFQFEAQVAAKLSRRTRHIVGVTDHGEEHDRAYLVMELVHGESLETMMRRERRCSLKTIAPIVAQVAKGLTAAHGEGVFHRDLKPANILLTHDEDGGLLVKILDFGIAKTIRSHKITGAREVGHETEIGIVLGTPNYMSPEQARGLATLDHRCDLWALSTIAYEALCGELPYDGETTADLLVNICSVEPIPARKFRPDLPPSADAFFKKAFAGSPNKRYQDAASLAAAFAEVAADAERSAELAPIDLVKPVAHPTDRKVEQNVAMPMAETGAYEPPRRSVVPWIALVVVLLLGGTFAYVRLSPKPPPPPATVPEPVTTQSVIIPEPTAPPATTPTPAPSPTTPETHKPIVATKPGTKPTPTPSAPPAPSPSPAPTPVPTKKPLDKGEIL
jgi:eukaryotic-like serine/threonine-protein kinase